jgi:thiamine biosynthesis lipoprotein
MGTQFHLIAYARSEKRVLAAFDAAAARLDALNASLSDYQTTSEVSRLSQASGSGAWHLLIDDVWKVLVWGNRLAAQSGGAFDMTLGSLTRLWRASRRTGKLPLPRRLLEARASAGHAFLTLDETRQRARLERPGTRLDLGGIAKGYAVDETLTILRDHGIEAALVDGGGDLRVLGSPPEKAGWQIQLSDLKSPEGSRPLTVTNLAVATSGDLYQSVHLDGREFSHLIDPQTGLGLEFRRTVTVVAPDAMTADALASALSVLRPQASANLLKTHYPRCAARILTRQADGIEEQIIGSDSALSFFQDTRTTTE